MLVLPFSYVFPQEKQQAAKEEVKQEQPAKEETKTESLSAPETVNWKGLYAGLHAGYGWGDGDTRFNALPDPATFVNLGNTTLSTDPTGAIAGGQIGYNWQKNKFIWGLETDFSWSGLSGSDVRKPFSQHNGTSYNGALTAHQDTDWFGTLRMRLGFAPMPKLLLYGTGGMAYGRVNYYADSNFIPVGNEQYTKAMTKTRVGWTVGGGAEYALTQKWSIKTEYLYYDLGTQSGTADPSIPFPAGSPNYQVEYKWKTSAQTVNVGLNYRF
ncbi:MAG: porin family protein [Candidatus Omnitrophica bacterium]|nr:porin family protein [Candidatus Omnitrophota bacterium]